MWVLTRNILISLAAVLISSTLFANTLKADFRHRPPEMVISPDGQKISGPLKEIIEEAAKNIGFDIEWRNIPFPRSLATLENGTVDIVPRVIRTTDREAFVRFIGPISEQTRNIVFVTRSDGPAINNYQDLRELNVGVKRGTAYFEAFDQDKEINRTVVNDDFNLARMLEAKRIDTVIVLDLPALEVELKTINFSNYQVATYYYPNTIGNYYGMPKSHPQADALQDALSEMVKSGRIEAIYAKFGLTAQ
ncbi:MULTISPECIES: substrate-binding periplasmic protein [unclassified Vibrio]|uniref:substrate-binding periplasmic protein n=1 Tax=unclassified Vibrio TaxID=2614977 RepID=UPI000B8E4149|nr:MULTISPECIES: transporter substrate-binding domain-containing protein [unclassified Vibrio]NAX43773.1 transporter substrate-binding domain-containing protein [Vibrio sp. V25_P4S6T154]OXX44787.1 amino acid ABC transporter substrate-binding protein [Vibrio sp. V17_P4S1T151]OXX62765.1 amino acid ABC transporter substrate-binding protein [Vibrio sp. V15_P4S5T153]OXX69079.1 amino acid ABC transporter substrate-binding protein [Vibrio sp. V20_P4S3T152]PRQ61423.1 amino acid ABC transporter substra